MAATFTHSSFHEALLADVYPNGLNSDDSMLLFALLHTHQINLASEVVSDAPAVRQLAAITQHHCALCLAYLSRTRRKSKPDRCDYTHWYYKWLEEWSYERVDLLTDRELERFHEIRREIEAHPAIESIEREDKFHHTVPASVQTNSPSPR